LVKSFDKILDILYPKRCPFCEDILEKSTQDICPECGKLVDKLYVIQEPICKKCGKPIEDKRQEYCYDCKKHVRSFERGFCLFQYGKRAVLTNSKELRYRSMGESMQRFKYKNSCTYAEYYIRKFMEVYGREILALKADAIIPVPIHKSKYRQRGYNQAEVLAKELAKYIGVSVEPHVLARVKKTTAQKDLTQEQRVRNLMDVFEVQKSVNEMRRVLLIDDIYTTGATMEACTRKLLEAGIKEVYCISICAGKN
jgi:ComF family protein